MPAYDYHCPANGRTVEARHSMNAQLATWGELCDVIGIGRGSTPHEAPLRRVIAPPMIASKREEAAARDFDQEAASACSMGECACYN